MVERKEYLEQLAQWKDEQVIKVITGIRRCGKSTLLLQYQTWLKANGVSADQIVSVNFEELEYGGTSGLSEIIRISQKSLVRWEKNLYLSGRNSEGNRI